MSGDIEKIIGAVYDKLTDKNKRVFALMSKPEKIQFIIHALKEGKIKLK